MHPRLYRIMYHLPSIIIKKSIPNCLMEMMNNRFSNHKLSKTPNPIQLSMSRQRKGNMMSFWNLNWMMVVMMMIRRIIKIFFRNLRCSRWPVTIRIISDHLYDYKARKRNWKRIRILMKIQIRKVKLNKCFVKITMLLQTKIKFPKV